jgi:transposase
MNYPTDLTDDQWNALKPILLASRSSRRGRPVIIGMRTVINAILYVQETGCRWRQLPKEFGPWGSIYSHFRRLHLRGIWNLLMHELSAYRRPEQHSW